MLVKPVIPWCPNLYRYGINGTIKPHLFHVDSMTPLAASVINRGWSIGFTVAFVMISGIWRISYWMINGAFLLPVCIVFALAFWPEPGGVLALWEQGMPLYLLHTTLLVCGAVVLSLLIGLPAAWVMAFYRFPGKRGVAWALCLPLAMPAFLMADFYVDVLGQNGTLWSLFDIPALSEESAHHFTLAGACAALALAFYPYIYLPVRHALESQPPHWLQAAQLLKLTPQQVFWRLSFPLVRPVIGMGATLVAVEALNDYGTARLLALPTLTTRLIDAGVLQGDTQAVAHWTLSLLPFIVLLSWLGLRFARQQRQNAFPGSMDYVSKPVLTAGKARLVMLVCWGLALLAVGLPLGRLLYWQLVHIGEGWSTTLFDALLNSLTMASLGAVILCVMMIPFLLFIRLAGLSAGRVSFVFAQWGYVFPGAALATGIAIPLIALDNGLRPLAALADMPFSPPVFSSVWLIMVLVYCAKFGRFVLEPLSVRMANIPQILDLASATAGLTLWQRGVRVYFPLLKPQVMMGAVILFFEGMKELNAAFLFRTFGWETLPTYVFRLAADNLLQWGALPALCLVVIGGVPMLWFQWLWKGNNQ